MRPALLDRLTEVLTLELSAPGDDDPAGFAALALDTATAYDVVLRGLGQRCPGRDQAGAELVTTWVELLVTASAVRLPAGLTTALDGADAVELAGGAATASTPVDKIASWFRHSLAEGQIK